MIILPLPYRAEDPGERLHPIVPLLIVANLVVYLLIPEDVKRAFSFGSDYSVGHKFLTSLTSQFLHGDFTHLVGNMWFLWLFGPRVEEALGKWFLPFYLITGIVASLAFIFSTPDRLFFLLGASGSIAGVIAAFCVLFPRARLRCFAWFIYRPYFCTFDAAAFGLFYFGMDYFNMWLSGGDGGVAHSAHLGGAVCGLVIGFAFQGIVKRRRVDKPWDFSARREGYEPEAAREEIERALSKEDHEAAVETFALAAGVDADFVLDSDVQSVLAEAAARLGRPHLARTALKRLARRHPADPGGAGAQAVLGWVEQNLCGNFAAAAAACDGALKHPGTTDEITADAGKRLADLHEAMRSPFVVAPAPGEKFCLLLDGPAAPEEMKMSAVARLLGREENDLRAAFASAPGVLAVGLVQEQAAKIAVSLHSLGVWTVALSEKDIRPLPAAVWVKSLAVGSEAATVLPREGAPVRLPWPSLSLISAGGTVLPDDPPKPQSGRRVLHALELVGGSPARRFRWIADADLSVDPETQARFYDALQDLVLCARGVPAALGAAAAFDRELPEDSIVPDFAGLDRILGWKLQLAGVRARRVNRSLFSVSKPARRQDRVYASVGA